MDYFLVLSAEPFSAVVIRVFSTLGKFKDGIYCVGINFDKYVLGTMLGRILLRLFGIRAETVM